jgi:hypothetical protein
MQLGYGKKICCGVHQNHCALAQEEYIVPSDFPNADLQKEIANEIKLFQTCIGAHGHHFQHLL